MYICVVVCITLIVYFYWIRAWLFAAGEMGGRQRSLNWFRYTQLVLYGFGFSHVSDVHISQSHIYKYMTIYTTLGVYTTTYKVHDMREIKQFTRTLNKKCLHIERVTSAVIASTTMKNFYHFYI